MCLKRKIHVEGENEDGHIGMFIIAMATRSLPNDEHIFPKAYFYNCIERNFLY